MVIMIKDSCKIPMPIPYREKSMGTFAEQSYETFNTYNLTKLPEGIYWLDTTSGWGGNHPVTILMPDKMYCDCDYSKSVKPYSNAKLNLSKNYTEPIEAEPEEGIPMWERTYIRMLNNLKRRNNGR